KLSGVVAVEQLAEDLKLVAEALLDARQAGPGRLGSLEGEPGRLHRVLPDGSVVEVALTAGDLLHGGPIDQRDGRRRRVPDLKDERVERAPEPRFGKESEILVDAGHRDGERTADLAEALEGEVVSGFHAQPDGGFLGDP